jgi:predicted nucleotidyltransferase
MIDNIQTELSTITQAIIANTQIESLFLFGSWAHGNPKPDSDLDIYLVIPDSDVDIFDLNAEIRYALYKKISLPLDLVIAKKSVFERRSKSLTLESIISRQGVQIYGNGNNFIKHYKGFKKCKDSEGLPVIG